MSYDITALKTDITGVQHGTTLNQIINLNNIINRAARELVAEFDPFETIRIQQLATPLFDKVYDYACPVDLKDDRIVDIRPQVKRTVADRFSQFYNLEFDMNKSNTQTGTDSLMTIQYNNSLKTLRLAKNLIPATLVNGLDSISDNGTWSLAGTATNLSIDTLNFIAGSGSLKFDASAGGVGSVAMIENSTMLPIDLTRDLNEGSEFVSVYFTNAAHITNVILRWGSDASNYWTNTVTTTQENAAFQVGWNLLKFDWLTATKVGSPDVTKTQYARVSITYDGTALTGVRVNNLVSQLGSIYEIEYYSKYLFRDSATGAFKELVTADTDIINLDTTSYEVFFDLVCLFCAQQVQATDGKFDISFFQDKYNKDSERYKAKLKSQIIKPQNTYYKMPRKKVTFIRYSSS